MKTAPVSYERPRSRKSRPLTAEEKSVFRWAHIAFDLREDAEKFATLIEKVNSTIVGELDGKIVTTNASGHDITKVLTKHRWKKGYNLGRDIDRAYPQKAAESKAAESKAAESKAAEKAPCAACPPRGSSSPTEVVVAKKETVILAAGEDESPIGRRQLGLLMHNWHASQGDPIYAVGSFYYSGDVYPRKEIVEDALREVEILQPKFRRRERAELEVIAEGLRYYLARDYLKDEAHDAGPICAPFTEIRKDTGKFSACMALARQVGPIDTDRKLYEIVSPDLSRQDQEIFVVLGLDLNNDLRVYAEVARGQRDRVAVNVEDILRPVLLDGCVKFAVAHNHPSGNARPSTEDGLLTAKIKAAAATHPSLSFLDHLVVGDREYYSFADKKLYRV